MGFSKFLGRKYASFACAIEVLWIMKKGDKAMPSKEKMTSKERALRNYTFQPLDRFTISPSQHLLPEIPTENIIAMYDAAWEYAWLD